MSKVKSGFSQVLKIQASGFLAHLQCHSETLGKIIRFFIWRTFLLCLWSGLKNPYLGLHFWIDFGSLFFFWTWRLYVWNIVKKIIIKVFFSQAEHTHWCEYVFWVEVLPPQRATTAQSPNSLKLWNGSWAQILKHFKVTVEKIALGKVKFSNKILKQPVFPLTAVRHHC